MKTGSSRGIFSAKQQQKRQARRPLCPKLAAVVRDFSVGSVMDIGAGHGDMVAWLRGQGVQASGLDGTPGIFDLSGGCVAECDLLDDMAVGPFYGVVSTGLFLEVGEHVPLEFESHLIQNVSRIPRRRLIVSWAGVGQRGSGHVNCKDPDDVAAAFEAGGLWRLDAVATRLIRDVAPRNYCKRLLVLER